MLTLNCEIFPGLSDFHTTPAKAKPGEATSAKFRQSETELINKMLEKKEKRNSGGGGVVAGEPPVPVEDASVEDPLLIYAANAPAATDHGPASLSYKSSYESTDHENLRANYLPQPGLLDSEGSQEPSSYTKNCSSSSSSSGRRSKSKDSRISLDDSIIAEEEPFIQPATATKSNPLQSQIQTIPNNSSYQQKSENCNIGVGRDEFYKYNEEVDDRVESPIFDYKSDENDDIPIIPGIMMHASNVSSDMDSAFEDESDERPFDARNGQRQRQSGNGNAADGGKRKRFASKPSSPPKDSRRHFRTFSSDYAGSIKGFNDVVENNDTWSKYPDRSYIPKYRKSAHALQNEDKFELQPLNSQVSDMDARRGPPGELNEVQILEVMKRSADKIRHANNRMQVEDTSATSLAPSQISDQELPAKANTSYGHSTEPSMEQMAASELQPQLSGETVQNDETNESSEQQSPHLHPVLVDIVGEDEYETKEVAPDGGYGWFVLLGSIIVNILIPGTVKSFGILFVEFIEVFKATPTEAAWIPALSYFLYSSTGPFASALSIKYSFRAVTIAGGLLAALGLMLSYFASSIFYLYISYGIIGGLGAGLAYPIGVFMIARYFEKRRGLANGLCTSGSALGSVIIPPFLRFLLENYGYRIAILIMGAVLLNVCLAALFYSPVEQHMKTVTVRKEPEKVYFVQETQTSFIINPKTSSNISIGNKPRTAGREMAASMPIAIPLDNRRDNRRATFQIGNETPQGGDSWSLKSTDSMSPLASRILSSNDYLQQATSSPRIHVTRNRPVPTSTDSASETELVNTVPGTSAGVTPSVASRSRLNLSAIPEDDDSGTLGTPDVECRPDWNSYSNLNSAKHQLMRLTNEKGSQLISSQASNLHQQPGLSRTLSLASNVSNSSFRYMSTIHHGSCLMSMQYNTTATDLASAMNAKSMKRSCWNCITYPKYWFRRRRAAQVEVPTDEDENDQREKPARQKFIDFSLFNDRLFIIMIFSLATTAIGYTNFIILLPSYAIKMGFDKSEASLLLSVVALLDFVGRIGGAAISDQCFLFRKWFFVSGLFFSGVSLSLLPLAETYKVLAAFCGCFGLASGVYVGLSAVILADRLGPEKLGSSYGITLFVNGIVQLLGPPICGSILQNTGKFEPIFVGLGIVLVIGALIWFLLPFIDRQNVPQNKEVQVEGQW